MRREHDPINNDEGVLLLAERVVHEALKDYIRLWARWLSGEHGVKGRILELEEFFKHSPFMLAVEKDYDEINYIVKGIDEMIDHADYVVKEIPAIIIMCNKNGVNYEYQDEVHCNRTCHVRARIRR